MSEPLTPDEDVVFREFLRLDVEPNQIPPELYAGFIQQIADTVGLPPRRVRVATQGLIDKDKFDTSDEDTGERTHDEREVLRDLLLHDREIRGLLRDIVAELCEKKR
jgi:hypothetical protein